MVSESQKWSGTMDREFLTGSCKTNLVTTKPAKSWTGRSWKISIVDATRIRRSIPSTSERLIWHVPVNVHRTLKACFRLRLCSSEGRIVNRILLAGMVRSLRCVGRCRILLVLAAGFEPAASLRGRTFHPTEPPGTPIDLWHLDREPAALGAQI